MKHDNHLKMFGLPSAVNIFADYELCDIYSSFTQTHICRPDWEGGFSSTIQMHAVPLAVWITVFL